jgi:hypothetical protein
VRACRNRLIQACTEVRTQYTRFGIVITVQFGGPLPPFSPYTLDRLPAFYIAPVENNPEAIPFD